MRRRRPGFDPEQLSSGDDSVTVMSARKSCTNRIPQVRGERTFVRNLDQLDFEWITVTSVGDAVP